MEPFTALVIAQPTIIVTIVSGAVFGAQLVPWLFNGLVMGMLISPGIRTYVRISNRSDKCESDGLSNGTIYDWQQ